MYISYLNFIINNISFFYIDSNFSLIFDIASAYFTYFAAF